MMFTHFLLPRITDLVCGYGPILAQRRQVVPLARGRVLEIGIGSGHNLAWYDSRQVERVFGLEPSDAMLQLARRRAEGLPFEVDFLHAGAERIPLDDKSVDTILTTFTMCSIADLPSAFSEMRRVLKPGGSLIYCEHGLAPEASVRRWQHRLNPLWKPLAGGCNLDRDIPTLIRCGGFALNEQGTGYISRFKLASFIYRGVACLP